MNIALGRAIPSTVSDSFFISLTAADYAQVPPETLRSAASNADTLEFRVDLLESLEPANVIHQVPDAETDENGVDQDFYGFLMILMLYLCYAIYATLGIDQR